MDEGTVPPSRGTHDLEGVRFLISHSVIQHIMGSTMVALELAEHLIARGATVTVWAAVIREPMRSAFEDAGATLMEADDADQVRLDDVDWMWVHSQALPATVIDQLASPDRASIPHIVFHHMAAADHAPDEHPYIKDLEASVSAISTFVSTRTHALLDDWLPSAIPRAVFPNPVPGTFASLPPAPPRDRPERVLVVSSHPPDEVREATRILASRGIEVVCVGQHQARYERVTPELLAGADAVVTIGKTVQYCLVAGVPVYVYDHFGGYGYLDEDVLALAQHRNFSGLGGARRDAHTIADELDAGFAEAQEFHTGRREEFQRQYSLRRCVDAVMAQARTVDFVPLTPEAAGPMRSAQLFGARYYRTWADNLELVFEREQWRRERDDAREESARLAAQADLIRQSRSYRWGNRVMRPLAPVARRARRLAAGSRST